MHTLIIVLTILAAVVGLYASYLWWKASSVESDLMVDIYGSVEADLTTQRFLAGLMEINGKSSALNSSAARWTAAAVFLSALAGIAGQF